MTPDEQNDAIRSQVEAEMPTPANGFETDELMDTHLASHERRFMELVNNSASPAAERTYDQAQ